MTTATDSSNIARLTRRIRYDIRDIQITRHIFDREVKGNMKEGIHPKTQLVTVKCACGNTFETLSTKSDLRVDICSNCHPFYTGKQKLVDTGGRVDKFKKRMEKA